MTRRASQKRTQSVLTPAMVKKAIATAKSHQERQERLGTRPKITLPKLKFLEREIVT